MPGFRAYEDHSGWVWHSPRVGPPSICFPHPPEWHRRTEPNRTFCLGPSQYLSTCGKFLEEVVRESKKGLSLLPSPKTFQAASHCLWPQQVYSTAWPVGQGLGLEAEAEVGEAERWLGATGRRMIRENRVQTCQARGRIPVRTGTERNNPVSLVSGWNQDALRLRGGTMSRGNEGWESGWLCSGCHTCRYHRLGGLNKRI